MNQKRMLQKAYELVEQRIFVDKTKDKMQPTVMFSDNFAETLFSELKKENFSSQQEYFEKLRDVARRATTIFEVDVDDEHLDLIAGKTDDYIKAYGVY